MVHIMPMSVLPCHTRQNQELLIRVRVLYSRFNQQPILIKSNVFDGKGQGVSRQNLSRVCSFRKSTKRTIIVVVLRTSACFMSQHSLDIPIRSIILFRDISESFGNCNWRQLYVTYFNSRKDEI